MLVRITLHAVAFGAIVLAVAWGAPALAAPAATEAGELAFSDAVNDRGEPVGQRTDFPSGVDRVWVSFEYRDHTPGARLKYIARAGGEDFRFGDLDCCGGSQGRHAFPVERRGGGNLGGAAYEVLIFDGDREIARGGFGVQGTQGFDENENSGNEGGGNDND